MHSKVVHILNGNMSDLRVVKHTPRSWSLQDTTLLRLCSLLSVCSPLVLDSKCSKSYCSLHVLKHAKSMYESHNSEHMLAAVALEFWSTSTSSVHTAHTGAYIDCMVVHLCVP